MNTINLAEAIDFLIDACPPEEIVEVWGEYFEVPGAAYLGWCVPQHPEMSLNDYTVYSGFNPWESDKVREQFGHTILFPGYYLILKRDYRRISNTVVDDWWVAELLDSDFDKIESWESEPYSTFAGFYGKLPVQMDFLSEIAKVVLMYLDHANSAG